MPPGSCSAAQWLQACTHTVRVVKQWVVAPGDAKKSGVKSAAPFGAKDGLGTQLRQLA